MITISANEAKQTLGQILDTVQREPVMIRKYNREAAVMMSPGEYDRLRGINVAEFSAFCDRVGNRAKALGLTERKLAEMVAKK